MSTANPSSTSAYVDEIYDGRNDVQESQDEGEDQPSCGSRLLFTRAYSVFNAAQVNGYTPNVEPDIPMLERIERAEAFFHAVGANVKHGGNRAYYSPDTDHIQMPLFAAFIESTCYYSTLAHEHTHWTAKSERCDRQLGKRFGDQAYAAEELIAELGAAFVCAQLGLSTHRVKIMPSTSNRGFKSSEQILWDISRLRTRILR